MQSLDERLNAWLAAGLISAEQAGAIRAHEAGRAARPAPAPDDDRRPSVLESILYLGVMVAAAGVISLTGQNWDALTSWARVAVLAVPGVLLMLAGAALLREQSPPLARAGSAAWLVAVALLAGAVAVLGIEADWSDRVTALVAALTAVALALALWTLHPSHAQVVALAGALLLLAVAAAVWPEGSDFHVETFGLLLVLFGATGIALGERGWLGPLGSARLLGSAGVMAGFFFAAYAGGNGDGRLWAELLMFLAGAALVALGLWRAAFVYVVVGVLGLFVAFVAFIFRHFSDELGAPLALLLSGAVLIAAGLLLALARRRLRAEAAV